MSTDLVVPVTVAVITGYAFYKKTDIFSVFIGVNP